jgi:hypothetical protein
LRISGLECIGAGAVDDIDEPSRSKDDLRTQPQKLAPPHFLVGDPLCEGREKVKRDGTHRSRLAKDNTGIRTTLNVVIVLLTQFATRRIVGKLGALAQQAEFFEVCIPRELFGGVARWAPGVLES